MLLGGLWHGAAWNFVLWGAFHGVILILYRIISQWNAKRKKQIKINSLISIIIMFNLTLIGWFFFRANSIEQINYFVHNIFVIDFFQHLVSIRNLVLITVLPLLIVQLLQHYSGNLLILTKLPLLVVCLVYVIFLAGIFIFNTASTEFIYFQF
jgi:D-alanyl-lipoteichoic acid acyltransferase DltB (MBOAT superfamily)